MLNPGTPRRVTLVKPQLKLIVDTDVEVVHQCTQRFLSDYDSLGNLDWTRTYTPARLPLFVGVVGGGGGLLLDTTILVFFEGRRVNIFDTPTDHIHRKIKAFENVTQ